MHIFFWEWEEGKIIKTQKKLPISLHTSSGYTDLLQTLDVPINKPFKLHISDDRKIELR